MPEQARRRICSSPSLPMVVQERPLQEFYHFGNVAQWSGGLAGGKETFCCLPLGRHWIPSRISEGGLGYVVTRTLNIE